MLILLGESQINHRAWSADTGRVHCFRLNYNKPGTEAMTDSIAETGEPCIKVPCLLGITQAHCQPLLGRIAFVPDHGI